MTKLTKSIDVEVFGAYERFTTVHTIADARKMKARYVCTDTDTDFSVYECSNGELIAVQA